MIGFRCECRAAIDCTYPNCNDGVEMGRKDITERLQDYARDYTRTTYHADLLREAATEIAELRQQLANTRNQEPVAIYNGREREYGYETISIFSDFEEGTVLFTSAGAMTKRDQACIAACSKIPTYQLTGEDDKPTDLYATIESLRQHVTLLHASVEELIPLNPHDTEHQYKVHHRALKALSATETKP